MSDRLRQKSEINKITVEHVDIDAGGAGVGWDAAVVARVGRHGLEQQQLAAGAACVLHAHPAILVVIDHATVVVPEHKHRRLGALFQRARQPQRAAALEVQVGRAARDLRRRLCKSHKNHYNSSILGSQ
jgi:hypothetical protein